MSKHAFDKIMAGIRDVIGGHFTVRDATEHPVASPPRQSERQANTEAAPKQA